jgi:Fe-Mn family superoxide dismutase
MIHTLPDLPYKYDALEPFVDEKTMRVHHDFHHQSYLDKFLTAIQDYPEYMEMPIEEILANLDSVPIDIRTKVRNAGGGYYHHSLFWTMMRPNGGDEPTGKLGEKIAAKWGSFESFQEEFMSNAKSLFGSGWTWLVKDDAGNIEIMNTPNQDSPITVGKKPVMGLDVWEHAYYLLYQNRRPEYIKAWWNVVNWEMAEEYYTLD